MSGTGVAGVPFAPGAAPGPFGRAGRRLAGLLLRTAPPRVPRLAAEDAVRLDALRARLDARALVAEVADLPAPRVRGLDAAGSAALDARLRDALTAAGWPARVQVHDAPAYTASRWGEPAPSVNVVAVREGARAPREAVVLLAHHDTVAGTGGADDNGSGVVALLAAARLLRDLEPGRTVVLALVDHEEAGLLGSRALVDDLTRERDVVAALVLEMVGYTDHREGAQHLPRGVGLLFPVQSGRIAARGARGDFTAVLHRGPSTAVAVRLAQALDHLAGRGSTQVLRDPSDLPLLGPLLARRVPAARDFARSDHVRFWEAGLPAVQVTDTSEFRTPHYHRPGDLPHTLDGAYLADVTAAVALTVARLAG